MSKRAFVVAALVVAGLVTTTAGAATITSITTFALPGSSTGSISTPTTVTPNNDNSPVQSLNQGSALVFFNTLGSMDVQFALTPSGGTTEYFFTFNLVNNTGTAWTDFHFELGTGLGAAFARIDPSAGLDFDTPTADPPPTSSVFTVLAHQPTVIDWSGGVVSSVAPVQFTLSIDVPDPGIQDLVPAPSSFTLRATPTIATTPVPEPGLVWLLVAGALGATRRTLRRG